MTAFSPAQLVAERYRLQSLLGAGGVGEVWRAHHEVLDVPVAVKLLHVHGRGEPRLAERMESEARAMARLTHPAIVTVFDFGATPEGDPFLVMELLRGQTLASMLAQRGRVSATYAVQLLLPIIDALAAAHALGIVHRDIKPENVFVASSAGRVQPKLLDFGIARMLTLDRRLTLEGTLVGTPEYMSPEQARGRGDLDFPSDIWSLCVVLYELVAGALPFAGDNYHALLRAVQEDEPATLMSHCAGDDALWRLIQRGLAKDPVARWPSVRELGVALARWLWAQSIAEDVCGASLRAAWLDANTECGLPPVLDPSRSGPASTPPLAASIRAQRRRTLRPALVGSSALALALALWALAGAESGARAREPETAVRVWLKDSGQRRVALPPAPAPPPQQPAKKEPKRAKPPPPAVEYDFGF